MQAPVPRASWLRAIATFLTGSLQPILVVSIHVLGALERIGGYCGL
jgi:hypothetical protein